MNKIAKQRLNDQFLIAFGVQPERFIQVAHKINLLGDYLSFSGGTLLTATIQQSLLGAFKKTSNNRLTIISTGYPKLDIHLDEDVVIHPLNHLSLKMLKAIIITARRHQIPVIGCQLLITHHVPFSLGLSTSTSFIMLLLHSLFHITRTPIPSPLKLAKLWQEVETLATGRTPSLIDGLTIAMGGIQSIDLKYPEDPYIQSINVSVTEGYRFVLIHVQQSSIQPFIHVKGIYTLMDSITHHFKQERLLDVDPLLFHQHYQTLQKLYGQKALDAATYVFEETNRNQQISIRLKNGDSQSLFEGLKVSFLRSESLLNHIHVPHMEEQRLEATIRYLKKYVPDSAYRIHGKGFDGPILLMIPTDHYSETLALLQKKFYRENIIECPLVNKSISIFKN
jgi:galactokinase